MTGSSKQPAVIVTGASAGIGRAFVTHLRAADLTVVAIARDAEALNDLKSTDDGPLHVLPLDLAEPDAADRIDGFLTDRRLYADVLINNAGIAPGGRFDQQELAVIEDLMTVNMTVLVRLTHRFLPGMRHRGRGGILNVASLAGFMPGPWQALYFASKSFVLSFSQSLAHEGAGTGVKVMVGAPGPVETRIHTAMKTRYAFYRRLFPSYEPDAVVRILWEGFEAGHTVLVPGLVSNVAALAAALVPKEILVPIVGFLVRPRFRNWKAAP